LCAELRRILVTPAYASHRAQSRERGFSSPKRPAIVKRGLLHAGKRKAASFARVRSPPPGRGLRKKAPPRTGPGSPLQHQIGVRKELLSSRVPRQFGAREMVPEARGEPCLLAQSSGRHPLLACPRQRPGTQYA